MLEENFKRRRPIAHLPALALLPLLLATPASLEAQSKLLGKIDFPNSGSPEAQSGFIEGVLYLHNFEYGDAARAFRRAQEIDPDFALAYWGEAMTHNHPIWMQQDRDAANEALERLAPTPEERAAKAPTAREKAYLHTVEILYGNVGEAVGKDKKKRDFLYRDALRRLRDAYPEDHEATSFYGLSILGTAHEGRDFAIYMRAAAALMPVWDANPKHPGAAHYLIHSFDDPIHAPLGLPMAEVYAKIAPAAAHAQHMTSHIFVAMGKWDDVVDANIVARDVQNSRLVELGERPRLCGHYTYWLEYGYLQQGRFQDAARVMDTCYESVLDDPTTSDRWHFGAMKARYALDTGDWKALERWPAPFELSDENDVDSAFIEAYAAARRGETETAREALEVLRKLPAKDTADERELKALVLEIEGLLALAENETDEGLSLLYEAEALETEMPYSFGPPDLVKPTAELLGDTLLALGRPDDAVEAFQTQLERTPLRTASLLGLARAASASQRMTEAADAYRKLAEIWHDAEKEIPGYSEVAEATAEAPVAAASAMGASE